MGSKLNKEGVKVEGDREMWDWYLLTCMSFNTQSNSGVIWLRCHPKTTQALNLSLQQSYCSFKK